MIMNAEVGSLCEDKGVVKHCSEAKVACGEECKAPQVISVKR
jgi:hypothetical protein